MVKGSVFGFVAAALASCTPTPTLGGDGGATDVALDAAADVADATAPRDVVHVEGGACVPACVAGQTCVDGVCEGDASVPDVADATADVWRPARAYQSCEPIGSDCGDGLTCLAVTAGATRGICTVPCGFTDAGSAIPGQCPPSSEFPRQFCERTGAGNRCVRSCHQTDPCIDGTTCAYDAGASARLLAFCAP